MGAGNLARKQIIQGLLFLAGELAYILYMVFYGAKALQNFVTLGTETQKRFSMKRHRFMSMRQEITPSSACSMVLLRSL